GWRSPAQSRAVPNGRRGPPVGDRGAATGARRAAGGPRGSSSKRRGGKSASLEEGRRRRQACRPREALLTRRRAPRSPGCAPRSGDVAGRSGAPHRDGMNAREPHDSRGAFAEGARYRVDEVLAEGEDYVVVVTSLLGRGAASRRSAPALHADSAATAAAPMRSAARR